MRYVSDLIYRQLEGLDAPQPLPDVFSMAIPPQLNPVVQLLRPLALPVGFVRTDTQRVAFYTEHSLTVANAASASSNVCTFGKGLWKIRVCFSYLANYTDGPQGDLGTVTLNSPFGGTTQALLFARAVANVPQNYVEDLYLNFPDDTWNLNLVLSGNGVGEDHTSRISVVASPLF